MQRAGPPADHWDPPGRPSTFDHYHSRSARHMAQGVLARALPRGRLSLSCPWKFRRNDLKQKNEFGEGRPDFGGRRPSEEASGKKSVKCKDAVKRNGLQGLRLQNVKC